MTYLFKMQPYFKWVKNNIKIPLLKGFKVFNMDRLFSLLIRLVLQLLQFDIFPKTSRFLLLQ